MNRQLKYIQTLDTGFNRNNVLVINAGGSIQENMETFKARMLEIPEIEGVSSSRLIPSNDLINSSGGNTLDGENPGPIPFRLAVVQIDYDFFENLAATHENFHYHCEISRETRADGRQGLYVHKLLAERLDEFAPLLADPRTLIYVCGLAGVRAGLFQLA